MSSIFLFCSDGNIKVSVKSDTWDLTFTPPHPAELSLTASLALLSQHLLSPADEVGAERFMGENSWGLCYFQLERLLLTTLFLFLFSFFLVFSLKVLWELNLFECPHVFILFPKSPSAALSYIN